jgi:malic enzyme
MQITDEMVRAARLAVARMDEYDDEQIAAVLEIEDWESAVARAALKAAFEGVDWRRAA